MMKKYKDKLADFAFVFYEEIRSKADNETADALAEVGATLETLLDVGAMALVNKDNLPFEEAGQMKQTRDVAFMISRMIYEEKNKDIVKDILEQENERKNADN